VDVGSASVGKLTGVFVASGGGIVAVLKGVACDCVVDMACTVKAAAVKTALGSSVAGAFEGRLHAASIKMIMNNHETKRMVLNILLLLS
jgi:hypothetical protein